MSRNGSGTYSLPAGNPVVTGTTISSTWANTTLQDMANALTGSVAADGQTPMTGSLDMNSQKIVDLAAGTVAGNAIEFAQFTTPTFTGIATFEADGTFTGTGQLKLPVGTTAQRSTTPVNGMIRFNSTTDQYEGYISAGGAVISTITHVGALATLTTATPHGLNTGDTVFITGCTPIDYNGTYTVTVTSNVEFTYTMAATPATDATVVGTYIYGAWGSLGGGATGGGGDQVFVENAVTVTKNYTLTANKNAESVGPITVNSGVTVTVPANQRWVIL